MVDLRELAGVGPGPTASSRRADFRAALGAGTLVLPGATDAMGNRLAEAAGFAAVYATGVGLANAQYGTPDIGLIWATEVAADTTAMLKQVFTAAGKLGARPGRRCRADPPRRQPCHRRAGYIQRKSTPSWLMRSSSAPAASPPGPRLARALHDRHVDREVGDLLPDRRHRRRGGGERAGVVNLFDLTGQVALVIGAGAGGLGERAARAFADHCVARATARRAPRAERPGAGPDPLTATPATAPWSVQNTKCDHPLVRLRLGTYILCSDYYRPRRSKEGSSRTAQERQQWR